ncbi:VWA domain-containing protein, partial [Pseudorhodobacter sp.]|uniref:VWA domain-containing protein n=1 Tax=Pseudorhodobacter sp. TaxID=1934400 RepID=UPI00264A3B40
MVIQYEPETTNTKRQAQSRFQRCAKRYSVAAFARDEEGSLVILTLALVLLLAGVCGLAVDVMRFEQRRTDLQQTLDRSVLAAASLSQRLNSKAVVTDYFVKAGLGDQLGDVEVDDTSANYRMVTASATSRLTPFFMQLVHVGELEASGTATAEQHISNVEVSLVLDISGSMRGSRINNLRPAAKEFVTTVLAMSEKSRVSMSIIPYNAQVNIGRPMLNEFNVDTFQDSSSCIELDDSAFTTVDLSTSAPLKQNSHFDPYNNTNNQNNLERNCPPQAGNTVTPLTDNENQLNTAIDNLVAYGNTSIDVGVKWGAYLLNRNSNPVIQGLAAGNIVPAKFANRPLDAATEEVLKVLVVMTDGENTTEYKINDPYNQGTSNIYRAGNGRVSVYFDRAGDKDYYWPRNKTWNKTRDGGDDVSTVLTWPEVWDRYSVTYVAT